MAYSNWGGKVWVDGESRHQNCDVTPKMLLNGEVYETYMLHFLSRAEDSAMDRMYHAIIGDEEAGILVGLYKDWPSVVINLDTKEELKPPKISTWDGPEHAEMKVGGLTINFHCIDEYAASRCEVNFVDKLGRSWSGLSGYAMGEGWTDWD